MTCKECIHHDLCSELDTVSYHLFRNGGHCRRFKNKADFVEVVRCKGCKYYERPSIDEDNYFCTAEHTQGLYSPNKNDFCSYGERKQ